MRAGSTAGSRRLGFTLGTENPDSAIIAVILPDQETGGRDVAGAARARPLRQPGAARRRPPPAPILLRCSLCAEHTAEQIGRILAMFRAAGKATGAIG